MFNKTSGTEHGLQKQSPPPSEVIGVTELVEVRGGFNIFYMKKGRMPGYSTSKSIEDAGEKTI
jgi:hypothetical protein